MCATCDFEFPGNIHVCPTCVSKKPQGLSARRRTTLIWSYVIACWTTFAMFLLMSGAFAGAVSTQAELEVFGMIIGVLIIIPAIIGTALSVSVLDRRLSNPPSVWGAIVWNGLVLLAFLLLSIIGNMAS